MYFDDTILDILKHNYYDIISIELDLKQYQRSLKKKEIQEMRKFE